MMKIHDLLVAKGNREHITLYEAHHALKDEMVSLWMHDECEEAVYGPKFVNQIHYFIPFFPLDRSHLRTLIEMKMQFSQIYVSKGMVRWTSETIDFFLDKVNFDGKFAVDGALDAELVSLRMFELLRKSKQEPVVKKCSSENLVYRFDIENDELVLRTICN